MNINFQNLKSIFDNEWDVGVLTEDFYDECLNSPIKTVTHLYGSNLTTNPITSFISNGEQEIKSFLVLAKKSTNPNDYSLYEKSNELLKNSGYNFHPVYLNYKKALVLSGMGVIAKNSLVYNRKFGFQCKICMYAIETGNFYNLDDVKIDRTMLDLCDGCYDCIKNCPVNAIHETYIDAKKCDDYIGFGNDKDISSMKWNWWEHIGKYSSQYTEEDVRSWSSYKDMNFIWEGEYKSTEGIIYKNNIPIDLKHCRKCQEQPRCSKMPINN